MVCQPAPVHRGRVQQGQLHRIPHADASFDVVFSSEVLEHVPPNYAQSSVNELARIAKGDGRAVGGERHPVFVAQVADRMHTVYLMVGRPSLGSRLGRRVWAKCLIAKKSGGECELRRNKLEEPLPPYGKCLSQSR